MRRSTRERFFAEIEPDLHQSFFEAVVDEVVRLPRKTIKLKLTPPKPTKPHLKRTIWTATNKY